MTTLSGVVQTEVGPRYDLAIGYDSGGGTATMVGYVLAQGQRLEESTDIQDNQRIVQIASPNSTDRFTYYPKVTQSNWAGGERQIIFVDPNRYYQSQKLETSQEGHLFIYGLYQSVSQNVGTTNSVNAPRSVMFDSKTTGCWFGLASGGTNNIVFASDLGVGAPTLSAGTLDALTKSVSPFVQTPRIMYAATFNPTGPAGNIWLLTAFAAYTNVSTGIPFAFGGDIAYFNDSLWYGDNSKPTHIFQILNPSGGGGPGVSAFIMNNLETVTETNSAAQTGPLGDTPTGLIFSATADPQTSAAVQSKVYTFDGVTATLVGTVPLALIDSVNASGVVFLLGFAPNANVSVAYNPVIYSYYNGTLQVFDDYRYLPSDFKPNSSGLTGSLSTDGTFLYMSFGGLQTKRYDLRGFPNVSVTDIGNPTVATTPSSGPVIMSVSSSGKIAEVNTNASGAGWTVYWTNPQPSQNGVVSGDTGYLITSYFDMGAPATTKAFRSFEIELNYALVGNASVSVKYNLDNQTGFANSLTMQATTLNNQIGYFPANTKAYRVQFKITLTANSSAGTKASPDIRSYSVNGRLGRVWKATLQARRQMTLHDGSLDAQGNAVALPNAQNLLGNIVNCYQKAAGNAILFIPDSTSATGVTQVNAVLEDYQISTPKPGPVGSEQSVPDMEADVQVTFVERL